MSLNSSHSTAVDLGSKLRSDSLQETVLEIEYIFAVEPAKPEQEHPHNDW